MPISKINSILNINLPANAPDGFTDPEVRASVEMFINILQSFLDGFERYVGATQKDITTWNSLLPSDTLIRHQPGRLYLPASEILNFGEFINLHSNAGVLNARKANGTSGTVRPAHGYCSTSAGIGIGVRGEVTLSQGILVISGVTPGQAIYISTSAGQATATPLTGAGQLEQYLGIGVGNNLAYIDISLGQYIQH